MAPSMLLSFAISILTVFITLPTQKRLKPTNHPGMLKTAAILVILAVGLCECQRWWEREIKDIPGVSAENMAKLRQIMTPRPTSRDEFKKKISEWKNGLPEAEKAAAEAHRQKMRELHHKNHPHPHNA